MTVTLCHAPIARIRNATVAGLAALAASASLAFAAGSVKVALIPAANAAVVGQPTTITVTVAHAQVSAPVALPAVSGLTLNGSGTNPGANSEDFNFFVTPMRSGDFTIPAFDIRADDGETLHVEAITLHAAAP